MQEFGLQEKTKPTSALTDEQSMAILHRIVAILLILLAAFLGWESSKLQFYTPVGPGAGFFPVCLSFGLALLGAVMLAQSFSSPGEKSEENLFPNRSGTIRILATLIAIAAFVIALRPLGFRTTTFLMSLSLIHVFGRVSPLISVPVSAGLSFGVYFVFSDVLKVTLPVGSFGY